MISRRAGEALAELDLPVQFTQQPNPIPPGLQVDRRVAILLLLVAKSNAAGASWKGLHLLNWVVRDRRHAEILVSIANGQDIPDRAIVRFEPAFERALDLAHGLGYLERKQSGAYRLTPTGQSYVDAIHGSDAFEVERALLDLLTGKVSQKLVDRMVEWRER
jgi:hypothetical protein